MGTNNRPGKKHRDEESPAKGYSPEEAGGNKEKEKSSAGGGIGQPAGKKGGEAAAGKASSAKGAEQKESKAQKKDKKDKHNKDKEEAEKVTLSAGEYEELKVKAGERDELFRKLQRSVADFENYQKRMKRDRLLLGERRLRQFVLDLLPAADDLERAYQACGQDLGKEQFEKVLRLLREKLKGTLSAWEIEPVQAKGKPFDPNLHEAIRQEEAGDVSPGHVSEELRVGYTMGGNLLRAAQVIVAAESTGKAGQEDSAGEEGAGEGEASGKEEGKKEGKEQEEKDTQVNMAGREREKKGEAGEEEEGRKGER